MACQASTVNLVNEGLCTLHVADSDTGQVLVSPISIPMRNGAGPTEATWIRASVIFGGTNWHSPQSTTVRPDLSVEQVGLSGTDVNLGNAGMDFDMPGTWRIRLEQRGQPTLWGHCSAEFNVQVQPWDGRPRDAS